MLLVESYPSSGATPPAALHRFDLPRKITTKLKAYDLDSCDGWMAALSAGRLACPVRVLKRRRSCYAEASQPRRPNEIVCIEDPPPGSLLYAVGGPVNCGEMRQCFPWLLGHLSAIKSPMRTQLLVGRNRWGSGSPTNAYLEAFNRHN